MTFSIKDFFSKWPNTQFPADLVTLTEEILNGKLHFLCSVSSSSQYLAQTAGDDPFKKLNEELPRLRAINPTEYEMSADEFLG